MIQHLSILTSEGKNILFRQYGATLIDHDLLSGFLSAFSGFFKEIAHSEIKSTQTENNKYFFKLIEHPRLIIAVCTDLEDENEYVIRKLEEIIQEFEKQYGDKVQDFVENGNRTIFQDFMETIDRIVLGPIKVSIIGFGGVGKTSLLRLIVGHEVNLEYQPTITADIAKYNELDTEGKRNIVLWDFAGQIQYSDLWRSLLKGTRIALLVTDSTFSNVKESKKIITELVAKYYRDCIIIGIANKQDLDNRLTSEFVEKLLGIPTHAMIAIDPQHRDNILEILRKVISKVNKEDGML
ncbi:MAG: GTP-binding protein [Promethearchaeota archaeon]